MIPQLDSQQRKSETPDKTEPKKNHSQRKGPNSLNIRD
jgi:hypothetical protein